MAESRLAAPALNPWELVASGRTMLAQVVQQEELRSGHNAADMEVPLGAARFRIVPRG